MADENSQEEIRISQLESTDDGMLANASDSLQAEKVTADELVNEVNTELLSGEKDDHEAVQDVIDEANPVNQTADEDNVVENVNDAQPQEANAVEKKFASELVEHEIEVQAFAPETENDEAKSMQAEGAERPDEQLLLEDRTEDQVPDITGTDNADAMATSMDGIDEIPISDEVSEAIEETAEAPVEDEIVSDEAKHDDQLQQEDGVALEHESNMVEGDIVGSEAVEEVEHEEIIVEHVEAHEPSEAEKTESITETSEKIDKHMMDASPIDVKITDQEEAGEAQEVAVDSQQTDEVEAPENEEQMVGEIVSVEVLEQPSATAEGDEPQIEGTPPKEVIEEQEKPAEISDEKQSATEQPQDGILTETDGGELSPRKVSTENATKELSSASGKAVPTSHEASPVTHVAAPSSRKSSDADEKVPSRKSSAAVDAEQVPSRKVSAVSAEEKLESPTAPVTSEKVPSRKTSATGEKVSSRKHSAQKLSAVGDEAEAAPKKKSSTGARGASKKLSSDETRKLSKGSKSEGDAVAEVATAGDDVSSGQATKEETIDEQPGEEQKAITGQELDDRLPEDSEEAQIVTAIEVNAEQIADSSQEIIVEEPTEEQKTKAEETVDESSRPIKSDSEVAIDAEKHDEPIEAPEKVEIEPAADLPATIPKSDADHEFARLPASRETRVRPERSPSPVRRSHKETSNVNYAAPDQYSRQRVAPPPRMPAYSSFSSYTPVEKPTYTALSPWVENASLKYRNEYTATSNYRPSSMYTSIFDNIVNSGPFAMSLYSSSRLLERSRSRSREVRNALRSKRSASNYYRHTSNFATVPVRMRDYSTPPLSSVHRPPNTSGSFISFMDYNSHKLYELARDSSHTSLHSNLSRFSSKSNIDPFYNTERLSRVESYVRGMDRRYENEFPSTYMKYRSSSRSYMPNDYTPVGGYRVYSNTATERESSADARYRAYDAPPMVRSMYEMKSKYADLSHKLDQACRQMDLLRTNSYSSVRGGTGIYSVYSHNYPYY